MKSYDIKIGEPVTRHMSRYVMSQSSGKPKVFNNKYFKPNPIRYYAFDFTYGAGLAVWNGMPFSPYTEVPTLANTNPTYTQIESMMSNAATLAVNKFIEELGSVRVNLYDLLRTRRESLDMITDRVMQMLNAARAFKKGRWRRGCEILGIKKKRPKNSEFPQIWLEYSYGWAPLVGDIYTICDSMLTVPSTILKKSFREDFALPITRETGHLRFTGLCTGKILATAKSVVTIDESLVHAMNQYGILNPFAVAWEAVPFSFVADWFIPIGDYLNQFNATAGLKFYDYSVTSTAVFEQTGNVVPISGNFIGASYCNGKQVEKVRYLGNAPVFNFPKITNPLDLSYRRCSYALSLLVMGLQSRR